MTRADKTLAKMRANPRDWRIETLETIAKRYDICLRKTGGSDVVFTHPRSPSDVTIPVHRPIKPAYILEFLALINDIQD